MKEVAHQINYDFEENYWWFKGRRKIIFDLIDRLCFCGSNPKVLDVGCGTGINMKYLQRYRQVLGVDVSMKALKFCKSRGINDLLQAQIENLPFQEDRFDLICALDILEHVEDDLKALCQLRRVCKKGGRLLITIPAFNFLWSGEDNVSEHKRRYTRHEIVAKAEAAGLKIEKATYFNAFLFPLVLLMIMIKRVFIPSSMNKSNVGKLPSIINAVLEPVFSSEAKIIRKFSLPFGTSVLILAQKC